MFLTLKIFSFDLLPTWKYFFQPFIFWENLSIIFQISDFTFLVWTLFWSIFLYFWDLKKLSYILWSFLNNMKLNLALYMFWMCLKIIVVQNDCWWWGFISDVIFALEHFFREVFNIFLYWNKYPTYCGPFLIIWH